MDKWGKRKDGRAYIKNKTHGISGANVVTSTGDIVIKEPFSAISHEKSTNGFHHTNNLKVDIYDSKSADKNSRKVDTEFVKEVQRAWNEAPSEIRDLVKRIVIKKVVSDNYKFEGRWNSRTKTLTLINFPNHEISKVTGVTTHELAHVWYTEKQKSNDPAVIEYQKKTDTINPVTYYAKKFYDEWQEYRNYAKNEPEYYKKHPRKKERLKKWAQHYRNEYYNEQHSETAQLIDLILRNYRGFMNINEDNTFKAIQFYSELHPEVKTQFANSQL